MTIQTTETEARRAWMGLLGEVGDLPAFTWLRRPEAGGVMVRGRMGGTGQPFNLGEMTVTRCALQIAGGAVGHAYVQGRDKRHAEQAALVDALMQTERAGDLRRTVLDRLAAERAARAEGRAAKAAATRVDFFTMVRGED